MFKKSKMDIIAGIFILIGTGLGIWANEINKAAAKESEEINSDLLSENNDLTKKIGKITDENLELSKKFDRYVKALDYFNKSNYDNIMLKETFPHGYKVVAQNRDFENFSKNFGESLGFEIFESKIIFKGSFRFTMSDVRFKSNGMSWKSIKRGTQNVSVPINPKDFSQTQFVVPFVIQPGFDFAVLMIDDGRDDFTYAVGFTPNKETK